VWTANSDPRPKDQRAAEMRIRIPTQITPQEAIRVQQRLAPLVDKTTPLPENLSAIVGCDASYVHETTVAAAVSLTRDDLSVQRSKVITSPTTFPYIPGLLAFREGSAVIRAIRAMRQASYVCMVDGHGLAHPRRFGLACFVGLVLDQPTIGVAKSLLYGSVRDGRVVDANGSTIAELITLPGSGKTIYVSVGHKISLNDAVGLVKRCLTPQGPLPIRLAHEEVTKRKWQIKRSKQASS
jgi:deoxyribonuclease V